MCTERIIRTMAGAFVLISLILGLWHSRLWFLMTAFVGLNLFQAGITNWCLLEILLKKAGVEKCHENKV